MRCLHPLTIKSPGFSDAPGSCPPQFWRTAIRPYRCDEIVVPCGKCIACLKNRQDAVSVRCLREAKKRGSFHFVTLTYDDNHLPLSKSLWQLNTDSGELNCLSPAELLCSGSDLDFQSLRTQFHNKKSSSVPRYIDLDFFHGEDVLKDRKVFIRVTPTCCRRDVQLWLKRARVRYERDRGFKLPDFSYIVVSEYGPNSCRPHYHIAFFGLNRLEVNWLCSQWTFGFSLPKTVNRVNDDNSDGWSLASRYIGKYMSKGKFECLSVKEGTAEKPRLMCSKSLGVGDVDELKPFVYCWDLVGKYDPFTLCKSDGSKLSDNQIVLLCEELPKRLFYRISSKNVVALPRYLRYRLFYKVNEYDKTKKTPSALWYLVEVYLRNKFASECDSEFREFLSGYADGEISKACLEFAYLQEVRSEAESKAPFQRTVDFYRRSRF